MHADPNRASAGPVEKKAAQLFPPEQLPRVMALLQSYGLESWEREADRVRLAVLKLSNGDLDRLCSLLDAARRDYRDVLAWAEYPNEMKVDSWRLDGPTLQGIREKDRRQYLEWLNNDGE